jgi:hypothetical protein
VEIKKGKGNIIISNWFHIFKKQKIKSPMRISLMIVFIFSFGFSYAQQPMKPGVAISSLQVVDSLHKKPVGSISLTVNYANKSQDVKINARGNTGSGSDGYLFLENADPDSMTFICNTPGYHVTGWKVRKLEHGDGYDNSGNPTGKKWWSVEVKVYVKKD